MGKHKDEDYIFPCVLVRSDEVNLLSEADLDRVLEQKTVQGAMNVLADFGYGDGKELANPRDFEGILRDVLERAYALVDGALPDEKEINLFSYPNDYHNAKVFLKAEFLKIDPAPYLLHTGTIVPEAMEDMIRKRDFSSMSVAMRGSIQEAIDTFSKTRDPQEIDICLDRGCYRDMLNDAEDSENEFVKGYIMQLIDILNMNTYVRLKRIDKPQVFFKKVFLEGGNYDEARVEQEAEKLLNEYPYEQLEKHLDDMKMDFVKDAVYEPFGLAPVVGYLVAKETENKNLRMILTGKIAGTANETIKERLRETYV